MNAASACSGKVRKLLQMLHDTQGAEVERAAEICAQSIRHVEIVFLFGAGHSHIMAEEMIPRQGAFVGFYALVIKPSPPIRRTWARTTCAPCWRSKNSRVTQRKS